MSAGDDPILDSDAAMAAISEQLSAIHTEFYGTPVARATTHILDDLVVCVLDIELMVIEQRMLLLGHDETILALRHEVQSAERLTFTAAVERATRPPRGRVLEQYEPRPAVRLRGVSPRARHCRYTGT